MFRLSSGEQDADQFEHYRSLGSVAARLREEHADPRVVEPADAAIAIVDAILESDGPMRYGCDPVSYELLDLWRQHDDETVYELTGRSTARCRPSGGCWLLASSTGPARSGRTCALRSVVRGKATLQFGVIIAVFPIMFIGELPDKTMFASLVMSTRGRPLLVWVGAAAAFAVHVAIAVTIGVALFHLLPHRALEIDVAAMFAAGGVLALREAVKEQRRGGTGRKEAATHRRVAVTAFLVIFLAEWGDLTQILTANLAAHYHDPLSVAVGAVLALWAVAGLAVVSGQSLLRW